MIRRAAVATIVGVMFLAGGCAPAEDTRPIDEERWLEVLVELHLATARYDLFSEAPAGLRDSIYANYGIDSAAVARTVAYYASRPKEYNQLYDRLLDRLVEEEAKLRERQVL